MVGLEIPVIPVQHQYIVTEPHPEIQKRKKEGKPEMGVLRDSDYSMVYERRSGWIDYWDHMNVVLHVVM